MEGRNNRVLSSNDLISALYSESLSLSIIKDAQIMLPIVTTSVTDKISLRTIFDCPDLAFAALRLSLGTMVSLFVMRVINLSVECLKAITR